LQAQRHGIGLSQRARRHGGHAGQKGKYQGKMRGSHTILQVIHWAAGNAAVRHVLPELQSKNGLAVFGCHGKKAAKPHPENGPWAADRDGRGNSGDIAVPNRPGKHRHHGLPGSNFSFGCAGRLL
jgi:hypothetical protein